MSEQQKDPFYVGYLPLPASIKKFIVPWLIGNFILAAGIAAVVAQQHRAPGDGKWDTGAVQSVKGRLIVKPYPMLRTNSGTYLLVEQGKIGTQDRVKDFSAGENVEVSGYLIERDGRKIIEIDAALTEPIKPTKLDKPLALAALADLGTHTLRGEIVDPKCYLGVMQPGDGKTHKVCATLCITGGIPPMLLVRDKAGKTAAYLLTDAQGKPVPESVYPYIADPIELTGKVLRAGDLLILQADLGSIRRLK